MRGAAHSVRALIVVGAPVPAASKTDVNAEQGRGTVRTRVQSGERWLDGVSLPALAKRTQRVYYANRAPLEYNNRLNGSLGRPRFPSGDSCAATPQRRNVLH